MMYEAAYFHPVNGQQLKCDLCPAGCSLKPGQTGICRVRRNVEGKLVALTYGQLTALHFDPIEKKPLYHFFPGSRVLSAGSAGCNLHCAFCQNWDISQSSPETLNMQSLTPGELLAEATADGENLGIAYTYNEPVINFEYIRDTATLIHQAGLKNIIVSNGYINPPPLEELAPLLDAANIDLKAFDDDFYRKYTGARLSPVLETLTLLNQHRIHTEITYLVIPGLNDDPGVFSRMCQWISDHLSPNTVLHLSRYFPSYKMQLPATPPQTLLTLSHLAGKYLEYVYVGNINLGEGRNTRCPGCGSVVIQRQGYHTEITGLDAYGKCIGCGHPVLSNHNLTLS